MREEEGKEGSHEARVRHLFQEVESNRKKGGRNLLR